MHPLEHGHVSPFSGDTTCVLVPRDGRHLAAQPLQHGQMPLSGSAACDGLIPGCEGHEFLVMKAEVLEGRQVACRGHFGQSLIVVWARWLLRQHPCQAVGMAQC